MHLFLLPVSIDDLSDAACHECVLMNIVVPAMTRETADSSPKRTRMKFQGDRVLLFMDDQREQVKAVTEHAEELQASRLTCFLPPRQGRSLWTTRNASRFSEMCSAELNKQASKRQQPPGRKKMRSNNEFFMDMRP